MPQYDLSKFLSDCEKVCSKETDPSQIVIELSPLLQKLIKSDTSFLNQDHFQSSQDGYARHRVYCNDDESLSLFTMVWSPGQWTPVHDHATWGVVGIVKGVLEEQAYMRADSNDEMSLVPGGNVLLAKDSVISFVPNPDHIHRTGVSSDRELTISLHLYGRALNDYYAYDLEKGTKEKLILS